MPWSPEAYYRLDQQDKKEKAKAKVLPLNPEIYEILGKLMKVEIHALSMQTLTEEEYREKLL